jgi:hypothetical protein
MHYYHSFCNAIFSEFQLVHIYVAACYCLPGYISEVPSAFTSLLAWLPAAALKHTFKTGTDGVFDHTVSQALPSQVVKPSARCPKSDIWPCLDAKSFFSKNVTSDVPCDVGRGFRILIKKSIA